MRSPQKHPPPNSGVFRRLHLVLAALVCASPLLAQSYSENFDDGVADNWGVIAGTWTIPTGTDRVYKNTTLGAADISVYNGATWASDYTYTVSVLPWGGAYGNQVGAVYYYKDASNYYEVGLAGANDANGKNFHLYEHVAGVVTQVDGNYTKPPSGVFAVLSIARSGNTTTIKVDGTTILTRTQSALTGGGKIGASNRFANGQFNNVVVAVPEVNVLGNGVSIADGDTTPTTGDFTDFGSADITNGTVARTFTIQNTGTATLTVGTVVLTGDFSLLAAPASSVVAGGNTTFTVLFDPTATGLRAGTVSFSNNDTNGTGENPYNFSIQGTGTFTGSGAIEVRGNADSPLATAVIPDGDTTQSIVDHTDFGNENVSGASTVRTYTIKNTGTTNLNLGLVSTGGSTEFTITDQPDSVVLPGAKTTFSVQFNPTSSGQKNATISFPTSSAEVTFNFAVRGTGVTTNLAYKSAFPRIGAIMYAQGSYSNSTFQAEVAKHDLVVMNFYRLWGGTTEAQSQAAMNNVLTAIRGINLNIRIGNYTHLESTPFANNASNQDIIDKIGGSVGPTGHGGTWLPNDWWGRIPSPTNPNVGVLQVNEDYPNTGVTNLTSFVTPDANGDRLPQWMAKRESAQFFTPVSFDFVYSDNTFYIPRNDVDWDRDGVVDSAGDATVQTYYRQGMAAYFTQLNASEPGLPIMGNIDGHPTARLGGLRDPEYQRKLEMGLAESMFGQTWSFENWSGWYNSMRHYRSIMDNTRAPHVALVGASSTTDGKSTASSLQANYGGGAAYAFIRYVLASTLMDDGYAEFHPNTYGQTTALWFDEFDLHGASTTSWLGTPIDPPQRTEYQGGCFFRRFQNGAAVVNPRTNDKILASPPPAHPEPRSGTTRVYIPASLGLYKHISGTQAPTVNNGQNLPLDAAHGNDPYVDLLPGDGILLLKQ